MRFSQQQANRLLPQSKKQLNCAQQPRGFTMICKPDQMSQGKGIFITNDLDQISLEEPCVVQEYVNAPFLIDGLKFDMRLYVLVLSCDPLKIYLHKEGLVRFATEPYKSLNVNSGAEAMGNMYVHLTNYSLNKASESYKQAKSVDDDQGHKRSLSSLYTYLAKSGHNVPLLKEQISDCVTKTLLSVQKELSHNYHINQPGDDDGHMCFELLGFDIMLDHLLKPILLEVNQAPSFATDSPLDM